jgi:general secretion pathway protein E
MRLGEMLLERQLITTEDLERALDLQKERGEKIGKILVDAGFAAARDVLGALSEQLRIPLVSIEGPPAVSPETEKLSPRFLRQFRCLPVALQDSSLTLAMADPLDFETLAAVRTFTGLRVDPVLAPEQEIVDAVDKYYGERGRTASDFETEAGQAAEDLEHLRDMASEAPVIRLVNAVIAQAVDKRASDIHIEPFEKEFRIRYRIDGVLHSQDSPPR